MAAGRLQPRAAGPRRRRACAGERPRVPYARLRPFDSTGRAGRTLPTKSPAPAPRAATPNGGRPRPPPHDSYR
jgi:hypothetical protein